MIGKDKPVSLSEVYVDLTILKQEPREVDIENETTYNDIAYLTKIAYKEVEIIPVDFTKELRRYKPRKLITYKPINLTIEKWKGYKQTPEI